jgi:trimethylamine--corrinoid protein Co-methyltransferase
MAVQPADVPASTVDVHTVRLALANTTKPLGYVCLNEGLIEAVLAMVAAVAGGEKRLRDRPTITALAESTSPLQLVSSQLDVLKAFASRGLPLTLHAHPIAGLTAPVTLAGELVVTHAEILALMTIAQLVEPGTPVVYGMSSSVPDMRNAANLSGAVEIGLLGMAVSQLARYCGVPCVVSSGSDAPRPGAQSVLERLMTLLPPALAGVDLINLSTLETKMSFSLEQLVIDDAVVGMVQRCLRGIGVAEGTLALDLIEQVGPAGSYVAEEHTLEHHRDELLTSELVEHQPREAWQAAGAPDLVSRAREKVEHLLTEHRPPPLPPSVVGELDEIVEAVEHEGGSPW